MNKLMLAAVFLAAVTSGIAQSRSPKESAIDFAKRNAPPDSKLTKAIDAEAWGKKKTVVAIYRTDTGPYARTDGYVFVPAGGNAYKKISIDLAAAEGLNPDADFGAIFFANADKDPAQELVILGSFGVHSPETMGTYYQTLIFDDVRAGSATTKLTYLKGISEKVSGGCHCTDDKGKLPAKTYQTAAQVRAGLKSYGF